MPFSVPVLLFFKESLTTTHDINGDPLVAIERALIKYYPYIEFGEKTL